MFNLTTSSLSPTLLIFSSYAAICLIVCWRNAQTNRFLSLHFAGFLLLPNQDYSLGLHSHDFANVFAYWYIGGALPSDIFLTKALFVPSTLALCLFLFRFEAIKKLRLTIADVFVAFWICLAAIKSTSSSAYILGVWGSSWLIGRAILRDKSDLRMFAWALVISTCLMSPFAIIEMIKGPFFYDTIYHAHPFTQDGAARYFGFRPMLMFEHGNQFGLWVAISAAAAAWLLVTSRNSEEPLGRLQKLVCVTPILLCLASQSISAIALFLIACFAMVYWRFFNPRKIIISISVTLVLSVGVLASGVIQTSQIEHIARNTSMGQKTIGFFRSIGKGSLPWRVSQDLRTASLVKGSLLLGSGRWDWWRSSGTRPWGLHQLIIGQFGIIGLALTSLTLGFTAMRTFWRRNLNRISISFTETQFAALLIAISFIDALLNSFIFYPMILLSAALASKE
jgi:hypothetical protein